MERNWARKNSNKWEATQPQELRSKRSTFQTTFISATVLRPSQLSMPKSQILSQYNTFCFISSTSEWQKPLCSRSFRAFTFYLNIFWPTLELSRSKAAPPVSHHMHRGPPAPRTAHICHRGKSNLHFCDTWAHVVHSRASALQTYR